MGEEGFTVKCGHINKQHYNVQGRLEDLACTLPKGHSGDHYARHLRKTPNHVYNEKGIVIQARYDEVEAETFWGDVAGTPASDIKEKEMKQLTGFQKDLLMTVMSKNPDMTVEDAIKQVRETPAWMAGNV